ncbi:Nramp family divalent metal transporter [Candidatus Collierbacteria bacterium]|nr:Nramp family divalent metal transporter [Candidatus Collierbacteria bacterium]
MTRFLLKIKNSLKKLGPGFITGIADDDPSGVMTYLIVGAKTGLSLLWTALFTIPMMISIQEMCARIGLSSKKGLAGNIKSHLSAKILIPIALTMLAVNILNIAANLSGMVASVSLLLPLPKLVWGVFFSAFILLSLIFFSYQSLVNLLRFLALTVLAYVGSALLSGLSVGELLSHTFLPRFSFDRENLMAIVAILGTTISPYLFFWQASEEVEERSQMESHHKRFYLTRRYMGSMRQDVALGMVTSNLVMFFIIASSAATLNRAGLTQLTTTDQAALALAPLAGPLSALLFTLGIIGTGLLAIPVLAGSSAYILAEVYSQKEGLNKSYRQARFFYLTIIFAVISGLLLSLLPINPLDLLFYTALVYGLLSPLLILVILYLANNKAVLAEKTNGWMSNLTGILTFILMGLAAVSLIFSGLK